MPRVRCPHGAHAMAVVGTVQPAHELRADAAAQHAAAFQAQALAGDDQHDAQARGGDVLEERPRRRARRRPASCHAGRARPAARACRATGRGRCRGRNSDRRAAKFRLVCHPERSEDSFLRLQKVPRASAFGTTVWRGLLTLSGFTPDMAAANRSTSLAMAFRVALAAGWVYTARHGSAPPTPRGLRHHPIPICRPACNI